MSAPTTPTLTLGTRSSSLARWQTEYVLKRLQTAWPDLNSQIRLFITSGDRALDKPLPEIGGKGVFTEELENALRAGEIDIAVHSLKDLPIDDAPSLILGAICEREDPRDVLISGKHYTLATLPHSAHMGTSSLRRAAQLLAVRPDLKLLSLRGNVDTRIRKAQNGDYDAIVLAAAGMLRLDLTEHITDYLPLEVMLPAPGQGALAVQCRTDDARTRALLAPLDHSPTRAAVTAERAFLDGLGGGCSAPIAAFAQVSDANTASKISLLGLVATPDGSHVIRVNAQGDDPHALGLQLAQRALAQGAKALLA